jgi:TetR/AcrR family transcriptional regulator, regulator of cefoperazone and chloramphenicol sensitivity
MGPRSADMDMRAQWRFAAAGEESISMLQTDPKARLIEASIDLFGQNGLSGVGTRAIADAAGVQMSTITYYFGGKDGLYLACADHIAATMRARTAPILDSLGTIDDVDDAKKGIQAILGGLVTIMMRDDVAPMARFVVREQMKPSPAFDVIYDGAIGHIVEALGKLLHQVAAGRAPKEQIRVRCMALIGQVLAFRIAHAALMRATNWTKLGKRETELVRNIVAIHTLVVLNDLELGGALSVGD